MKKTILFTLLALVGLSQAAAQEEYEYVPFVREGVKWVYSIQNYNYDGQNNPAQGDNMSYRTLELKRDTVINGKTYKVMHKYSGTSIDEENDTVPVYLREEGKIVYGIIPDGRFYYDCPIYKGFNTFERYDDEEFVLYDFNDPVTFYQNLSDLTGFGSDYQPLYEDFVQVGNHLAKRHVFDFWGEFQLIEGVGFVGARNSYTLSFIIPVMGWGTDVEYFRLCHVIEDGEIIYEAHENSDDRYLPIIREGVKWINEKVTVNHGDTTCYYYAYQFKGNAPFKNGNQTLKALYYSEYAPAAAGDSLIAGLREDQAIVESCRNYALSSVIDQGRNCMRYNNYQFSQGLQKLYAFNTPYVFSDVSDFFINQQLEQFLTEENFFMIEPIEIDGVKCSRCAYFGENGEPLAYIIEGIGFDSYDMGDLLTPFTRKPDPDAEYQEYWGLSHVIKDGQIIYKGMRYREGTLVGIDETMTDRTQCRPQDPRYYDLMGRPVGTEVPSTPGIYIHQGKKIVVR